MNRTKSTSRNGRQAKPKTPSRRSLSKEQTQVFVQSVSAVQNAEDAMANAQGRLIEARQSHGRLLVALNIASDEQVNVKTGAITKVESKARED